MSEPTELRPYVAPRGAERRLVLLLLAVGAALVLLLLNLAGSQKTFDLIANAQPGFVLALLVAQALHYAGSAGSTAVLAQTFGVRLPLGRLYEAMLAGQALNRTFSVGGAAGMVVRYSFLTRESLHSGAVAALFIVDDVLGAIAVAGVFGLGLALVLTAQALPQFAWPLLGGAVAAATVLAILALELYRRRAWLARLVHLAARLLGLLIGKLIGKEVYQYGHVEQAIDDFYGAMEHARRAPLPVSAAFGFNLLRLGLDAASLYLAFWAVGFGIAPPLVLVIFTSSSALSTLSGVPGELGVMETSLAMLSTSLGIAPPTAVSAIVLFRALSYWLPIPFGYLAFWHLQREGYI